MTPNHLKRMYGSTPQSFQNRIQQTLAHARVQQTKTQRRPVWRTLLITALVLAFSLGTCLAVFHSQVAEYFGWFYGEQLQQELLQGNIAQQEHSVQIGDVLYTLQEVTYIDNGLYGVGLITPANENVVLMAEDYSVSDAAGYGLFYGPDSRAPKGTPTYAELAAQKNAKIIQVSAVPEAVGVDGGTILPLATAGYSLLPQPDGSVKFAFEISTGVAVEEGSEYVIRMWSSNWEVTPEGEWLREEPNDTYQGENWDAIVYPKPAKEMK